MAQRKRKLGIVAQVMNERVPLLGCPDIIVTRHWAYQWYVKMGMSQDPRDRFASADWAAFGLDKQATDEPLTDLTQPWVVNVLHRLEVGI